MTKKELLEAIKDMPEDAKITFYAKYACDGIIFYKFDRMERLPYGYGILLKEYLD